MAEATFTPALPPGGIVDAAFSGASQMQSLMDRGQLMRQRSEQAQREQQIYDVGRPVMEAKAQADLVIAQNTLKNAEMLQNFRAKVGDNSTAAQSELEQALQVGNYEEIAQSLSKLGQKYAYFNLVPEGKPFIDTVKNYQLQFHGDAVLNRHTLAEMDLADVRNKNTLAQEHAKALDLRETYSQIGKGKTHDAITLDEANKAELDGDPEKAKALRAVVTAHATKSKGPVTRSEQVTAFNSSIQNADTKAVEAEDAGDLATAARWHMESANQAQAKKNYLTNPAGQPPDTSHWTTGAPQPPSTAAGGPGSAGGRVKPVTKLYVIDPATNSLLFSPAVKTPEDQRMALQQALDAKLISPEQARATMDKLGFIKKK